MVVESTTGKRKVWHPEVSENTRKPQIDHAVVISKSNSSPGGPNVNAQQVHFGQRRNHLKGQGQKTLGLCGTTVEKNKVGENKYG